MHGTARHGSVSALLVCNARRTVIRIDYPASDEARTLQQALHHRVVGMGVGTQIAHSLPAPADAGLGDSADAAIRGEPVYGTPPTLPSEASLCMVP